MSVAEGDGVGEGVVRATEVVTVASASLFEVQAVSPMINSNRVILKIENWKILPSRKSGLTPLNYTWHGHKVTFCLDSGLLEIGDNNL